MANDVKREQPTTDSSFDAIRLLLHQGVNLSDVPAFLWRTRRITLLSILVPVIVAGVATVALPRWYESGATLTVDTGTPLAPGSSVLNLASQLGLAGGAGSLSPQFYADLLTSRLLLERILSAKFPLGPSGELESLDSYWNTGTPVDLRAHVRSLRKLRQHLSSTANIRTGVISLTMQGPNGPVAKLMADTALAALNDMVVSIRRRHASAERQFLEERWRSLHDSLSARESLLRAFYERNRQITSPQLQFEELQLRREVDRVQSVYAQIGMELEQARIQEVRDVPAISVIDPPMIPVRKAAPRVGLILVTGAFVGLSLAIMIALLRMATLHRPVQAGAVADSAHLERV